MTVINTHPPVSSISFHIDSRSAARSGNYENELDDWARGNPDRQRIADQIREQGGEHATSLSFDVLDVHHEAPPLPPSLHTVTLQFAITDPLEIKRTVAELVQQAVEALPEDRHLEIQLRFQNSMGRDQVDNLLDEICTEELALSKNITLSTFEEYATRDLPRQDPAVSDRPAQVFAEEDAEFADQVEGSGCVESDDQIEGYSAPASDQVGTTNAATRSDNEANTAAPVRPDPIPYAQGAVMFGEQFVQAEQAAKTKVIDPEADAIISKTYKEIIGEADTPLKPRKKEPVFDVENNAVINKKHGEISAEEDEFEPGLPGAAELRAADESYGRASF